jgi:DNA-binding transcriptional ArsR family regulator
LLALADGTRRQVLELVAARPRSVGEIAAELPVSRPAVSQHLKVLLDAGLVSVTAEGTRRLYVLDPSGLAPLRAYLEQFWNRSLADFKQAVEGSRPPVHRPSRGAAVQAAEEET